MKTKAKRKFVTRQLIRVVATGQLGGVGEVDYSAQYGYTYFVDHNDVCDWYTEAELKTVAMSEPDVPAWLAANKAASRARKEA